MKSNPVLFTIVVGLGLAIIFVLALMIGLAIKRSGAPASAPTTPSSIPVPGNAAATINPAYNTFNIREGTTVADARIDGGLLIVRTTNDYADEILTFDPRSGQLISRITLKKTDQQ